MAWSSFLIGMVVGACVGVLFAGLLRANDDGETKVKPVRKWWEGDDDE